MKCHTQVASQFVQIIGGGKSEKHKWNGKVGDLLTLAPHTQKPYFYKMHSSRAKLSKPLIFSDIKLHNLEGFGLAMGYYEMRAWLYTQFNCSLCCALFSRIMVLSLLWNISCYLLPLSVNRSLSGLYQLVDSWHLAVYPQ